MPPGEGYIPWVEVADNDDLQVPAGMGPWKCHRDTEVILQISWSNPVNWLMLGPDLLKIKGTNYETGTTKLEGFLG